MKEQETKQRQYIYFSEEYSYLYLYALFSTSTYTILKLSNSSTDILRNQIPILNNLSLLPIRMAHKYDNDSNIFKLYFSSNDIDDMKLSYFGNIHHATLNEDLSIKRYSSGYMGSIIYNSHILTQSNTSFKGTYEISQEFSKKFVDIYTQPLDSETLLRRISLSYDLGLMRYSL